MRVLIVDDEPAALERLSFMLEQIPGVLVVGTASDGAGALKAISDLQPDLVLLDIQMPDLNGLTVAARMPAERRPEIVFVTAFEIYAADAFEVEALDYLLKPVRFDRLRQAMDRAKRRRAGDAAKTPLTADTRAIWVQTRNGSVRVPLSDIDWIEASRDYVLLHTSTRSYLHRSTMSALEADLKDTGLIRVHRSAFVRADRVLSVQGHGRAISGLILANEIEVPVGSTYAPHVLEMLNIRA